MGGRITTLDNKSNQGGKMFFRKNEEIEVEEVDMEGKVIEYCANLNPSEWTLLQKRIEIWQKYERAVKRADKTRENSIGKANDILQSELSALEPKKKSNDVENDEDIDELGEAIVELKGE